MMVLQDVMVLLMESVQQEKVAPVQTVIIKLRSVNQGLSVIFHQKNVRMADHAAKEQPYVQIISAAETVEPTLFVIITQHVIIMRVVHVLIVMERQIVVH